MVDMDAESWQMSVEELLAVQSILQSSLVCFVDGIQRVIDEGAAEELIQEGCRGRQLSCTAYIHPSVPERGLTVQVKALMGFQDRRPSAQQGKAAATSHVQHLPPICLAISFPDNYPQQYPPDMQLTVEWLSTEQADSLTEKLLELWKEQGPGCPVCFTWTDWLQNEALQSLGITDVLLLTFDPHDTPAAGSSPHSLAAGGHRPVSSQVAKHASQPAACSQPGCKPSADSLQSNGTVAQQLAHSSACQRAAGSALTPEIGVADSRQPADTPGVDSASMATSNHAAHTDLKGEPVSLSSAFDAKRPGRLKQRGSPHRTQAMLLDPRAAAWQPSDNLEATSSPQLATERQSIQRLQDEGHARAQQSKQAGPSSAVPHSSATVLLKGKAKLSDNSSGVPMSADIGGSGLAQTAPVECRVAGSSTAGASQAAIPGSELKRVVQLYLHLTAYSKSRERQLFQEGQHTCSICLDELPGAAFIWPGDCDHASCKDCVKQLCNVHVAEGGLENLRCPDSKCKAPFNRQCLGGLLEEEQLQRWEDLELAVSLQKMPDCVYCPRCSSACLEDAQNCAQCAKCFFAFCSLCNESWHPGIECMSAETKLELLRQRMAGMSVCVAELRSKELEYMSLVRIQETSKRCPACGMAIQKSAGCNKMTCGNCGAFFCWRCNKEVDGYEHFHSGKCILFDHAEIQRWEVEFQVQIDRAQAQARNAFWGDVGGRRRSRACPSCGQANHKMNENNHMRCWACTAHFCYLCRQTLRGTKGASGSHFGKAGSGKCRQHSPD